MEELHNLLQKIKNQSIFEEIPFSQEIFQRLKVGSVRQEESPLVVILCGPPGSGKSTIKNNLLREKGITHYIDIDPDTIRAILTENGVNFIPGSEKIMGNITNAFNERICRKAQEQGLNIVFDTTGQNYGAISKLIESSYEINYKIIFSIIWASLDSCIQRVKKRNDELERTRSSRIQLPEDIVRRIYDSFMKEKGTASLFLIYYPVNADEIIIYDNSAEPILLYHKASDFIFSRNFSNFYNMQITANLQAISLKSSGGKRKNTRKNKKSKKHKKTKRNQGQK